MRLLAIVLAVLVALGAGVAAAQDKPRSGGELVFVVPSEPPSYDGHAEGTFGVVHPLAPHYNGLLRVDPFDRGGSRIVAAVAESWTVSRDGLTYTLRLRSGVRTRIIDSWRLVSSMRAISYPLDPTRRACGPPAAITWSLRTRKMFGGRC